MSSLLFKRFLARPLQVAYILPSSKALIKRVASKLDFSRPRTIVEFGPGEGCHTRELVRRMHPDSRMLLFELDPELAAHLEKQFADDPRVEVLNADAASLKAELAARGIEYCDYVVSGIPFSILEIGKKRSILRAVYESLAPAPSSAFIIYQCTNELKQHATMFPRTQSEYFLPNFPPMVVAVYYKQEINAPLSAAPNGNAAPAAKLNGHAVLQRQNNAH
ncbi:MAG TPA: rRNA adenine N-6-methyltransferase family protein [Chthoniobacteraceae bacterium]|nr:rRNA adenine N-6-methyltransferase family protein [Chthoniobacteraceae bacterium]